MTPEEAPRRTQQRGNLTRQDLLEAALQVFASVGFEAASTRTIAARAGLRQGQLTYHFETKDDLWRSTVDHLFQKFDAEFEEAMAAVLQVGADSPEAVLEANIRALVVAVSQLPELNRVMVHEATEDSGRLRWIVERHVRNRFNMMAGLWAEVKAASATHLDADPVVLYYCLLGAASLLYVNAPEAQLLMGARDPVVTQTRIQAHADTLVAMLLGPRRATRPPEPHVSTNRTD